MQLRISQPKKLPQNVNAALRKTGAVLKSFRSADFSGATLFAPSTHLLKHEGKMVRPALVLVGADVLGEPLPEFTDLAAAAELLHTSSLIHDDIIDGDMMRRGTKAVHAKYGQAAAILAGDALISKAVELSSAYGREVMLSISKTAMLMCAGELLDYEYQRGGRVPSLSDYIRIARLKSASITGMCSSIAAQYKRHPSRNRLETFGVDFGIALQIRDDVIDFMRLDRGNGSISGNGGPNIVTTLIKRARMDRDRAVRKAVSMNNSYLDHAAEMLAGSRNLSRFAAYSEFIRLELE
ncbi:MAG: polyprenyl synthetase family protein [Candidatus Micrarchaeota archaeon]|nr:polyprenyl synthetase family protein [Candidatus Micrarchaeota archaeon]